MEEITKEMVSEQPRLRLQWLIQEVSKIVELPIKRAQPRRPITRATRQRAVAAALDESSKSDSSDESDGDEIMHRFERKHLSLFNCILHAIHISHILQVRLKLYNLYSFIFASDT